MGEAQLRLLQTYGAEGHSNVLDVGCGSLRLGRKLIPVLQSGCYTGLDISERVVRAGIENELPDWRQLLQQKQPTFVITDRFELPDVRYDFAIAHSVFTHIDREQIGLCIRNVIEHLAPDGVFLASYNRSEELVEDVRYPDMTYYPESVMRQVCEQEHVQLTHVGKWGIRQNKTDHQLLLEIRP
jgi:SAM-dependent methyltransferase